MKQKLFKLALALLILPALSFAFTSCGDDDDDDKYVAYVPTGTRPLTGTWESTATYGFGSAVVTETLTYVFNADGTGMFTEVETSAAGTETEIDYFTDYIVSSDGHLLVRWIEDTDYDDEGAITITPTQFTLTDDDGDVETYIKK